MGDLEPVILGIVSKLSTSGGDATAANQTTIIAKVDTVDGLHDVPAKDAATDAKMRDVVGKKDDTAVAAVGTTKSLVAYVKGVMNDLSNATDGLGALKTLIDTCTGYHTVPAKDAATDAKMRDVVGKKDDTAVAAVGTTKSLVAYVKGVMNDLSNATDGLGALKTLIDTVKAKTDLMNSASGSSTLNDANPSDTIVPSSLPTKMHVILDISTIIVAGDDFTLEVKVGAAAAERVVAYYKITSDGTDTTIDTGSGTGAVVKQRRIDISDIMVYTGEQVLLNYTKNGATDRNVVYKYICGV